MLNFTHSRKIETKINMLLVQKTDLDERTQQGRRVRLWESILQSIAVEQTAAASVRAI